ncbi:RNA polymerase factor sigma-54 [Hoylesella loescheii]|jgi:RNA polymerase sigma-54 factor|uniref:RNA polymerase factor sigma-54 n=1 Tax=Hoylesella loescheii TaxID=840 RepID=UPI0026EEACC4|nr:RNA polymerase factor sigma-54 [Hoylesella loescheii]
MAQKLIQTQTQKQVQVQRLSQQQMLQVRLLEMPLTELEQSVIAELDDNPALETDTHEANEVENYDSTGANDDQGDEDFDQQTEREEREQALDAALENIGRDDEMPETFSRENHHNAEYEEIVYGDTTSFYDKLKEQVGEIDLNDEEEQVQLYLIGSLDSDGLLRKDLDTIADELAIYQNLDVETSEIERMLGVLQTFDPAGIGARSLKECLLIQIARKPESWAKEMMRRVIDECFDAFTKKHWDAIQTQLQLTGEQVQDVQAEIRKLNPKPGASMGETQGRNLQQITPDFIVDTDDDGKVSFYLSRGNIPQLMVSPSFADMVDHYRNNKANMTKGEKEALLYAKEKVEKAQGYIEAIKQRRHTLSVTMQAIIDIQRKFFVEGDEADLRPMILKDIADRTGLDISTISRVSNIKYVQTKWGTFPLRFFFTDAYTTGDGEELSTRKIKIALKELIDNEDKKKPLSDDLLKEELAKKGLPIARRTVAKYREQLGLPVARLRKG